jgi:hypothetical protein
MCSWDRLIFNAADLLTESMMSMTDNVPDESKDEEAFNRTLRNLVQMPHSPHKPKTDGKKPPKAKKP